MKPVGMLKAGLPCLLRENRRIDDLFLFQSAYIRAEFSDHLSALSAVPPETIRLVSSANSTVARRPAGMLTFPYT